MTYPGKILRKDKGNFEMKYKIVHGDDEDELTERVNEAIKEGWIAQGGVAVLINTFDYGTDTIRPYSDEWHQAMIKMDPPDKKPSFIPVVDGREIDSKLGW